MKEDKRNYTNLFKYFMMGKYEIAALVDADSGKMDGWYFNVGEKPVEKEQVLYNDENYVIAHNLIVPEEREQFLKNTSLTFVKERLQGEDVYYCTFNTIVPEEGYRTRLWEYRYTDASQEEIFAGISDLTEIQEKVATDLQFARTLSEKTQQEGLEFGADRRETFYRKTRKMFNEHPHAKFVLIRVDVDRFKVFNEIFGMAEGDRLLRTIGEKMQEGLKEPFTCGHIEADHFALCCPAGVYDMDEIEKRAANITEEYRDTFNLMIRVGLYYIQDPTLDISIMCSRALIALKKSKGKYGLGCQIYDDSFLEEIIGEQRIIDEGTAAMEKGQMEVWYQPMYDERTGAIISAEALIRWPREDGQMIMPDSFIPVFEKAGLISNLDRYVCHQVCGFIKEREEQGAPMVPVSFNVSREDILYSGEFSHRLAEVVEQYEIPKELLRVEITESAYIKHPELIGETVRSLQKLGLKVYMDDFGSGYSSLNTLKDIEVDFVKMDKAFCDEVEREPRAGSIMDSILRLLHHLQIPVITEGVENKEQAKFLQSIGCRYMQGYYFSRPIPQEKFAELLSDEGVLLQPNQENVSHDTLPEIRDRINTCIRCMKLMFRDIIVYNVEEKTAQWIVSGSHEVRNEAVPIEQFLKEYRDTYGVHPNDNNIDAIDADFVKDLYRKDGELNDYKMLENESGLSPIRRVLIPMSDTTVMCGLEVVDNSRALMDNMADAIEDVLGLGLLCYRNDERGTITYINDQACDMLGYDWKEIREQFDGSFKEMCVGNYSSLDYSHSSRTNEKWEAQVRSKNGEVRWISGISSYNASGDMYSAMILDATKEVERAKKEKAHEELVKILNESSNTIIFDYETGKDILVMDIYGLTEGTRRIRKMNYIMGSESQEGYLGSEKNAFARKLLKAAKKQGEGSFEFRGDYDNAGLRWKRARYSAVADESGSVYRVIGRIEDVEEELQVKNREAQWKQLAQYDNLMGIYTRTEGVKRIADLFDNPSNGEKQVMFLIDIDDFKGVNDTLGHVKGDELLRKTGNQLRTLFRSNDILCRYGGDEILVVVNEMPQKEIILEKAEKILNAIRGIHLEDNRAFHCSIGIAVRKDQKETVRQLFIKADKALYQAKNQGKDRYVIKEED